MAINLITEMVVSARPIEQLGNLHGFASVTIGGIRIDDFKIVENKDGELFVGMPSRPDKNSETGYRNTVFIEKEHREDFNAAVLDKYRTALEKAQTRTEKTPPAQEKPKRMADQVAEASKAAAKNNVAMPPKEKSTKTRATRGE